MICVHRWGVEDLRERKTVVLFIMSGTVQSFKVSYNPINDSNTFTSGDIVSGQVELEVAKECEIQSLSIKFKGKAEVLWTERHGKTTVVYHSKDKYFSIKLYFIQEKNKAGSDNERLLTANNGETYNKVVAPGRHVYPFTFQFPMQKTPSSFHADTGKIVYLLEAKLSRSMRLSKNDSTKLNFVSQYTMDNNPELRIPQHDSKDKKLKLFNSGTVSMDVNLEKTGYYQGEGIKVLVSIENKSSREIRPKYCVYSKHSFFANGKRKLHTKDLIKEVGAPIPPSASEKVTQVINIPHDMEPSIHNCEIIKVEHRLRVYLDVKYASDPEIKFPIVILRAHLFPESAPPAAASDFGFGIFGNASSSFYNPISTAPQPGPQYLPPYPPPMTQPMAQPLAVAMHPSDPPPPYTAYGLYPTLPEYGTKPQQ